MKDFEEYRHLTDGEELAAKIFLAFNMVAIVGIAVFGLVLVH